MVGLNLTHIYLDLVEKKRSEEKRRKKKKDRLVSKSTHLFLSQVFYNCLCSKRELQVSIWLNLLPRLRRKEIIEYNDLFNVFSSN